MSNATAAAWTPPAHYLAAARVARALSGTFVGGERVKAHAVHDAVRFTVVGGSFSGEYASITVLPNGLVMVDKLPGQQARPRFAFACAAAVYGAL